MSESTGCTWRIPCDGAVVAQRTYGCVHEHLTPAWLCQRHDDQRNRSKWGCKLCRLADGHVCVVAEIVALSRLERVS